LECLRVIDCPYIDVCGAFSPFSPRCTFLEYLLSELYTFRLKGSKNKALIKTEDLVIKRFITAAELLKYESWKQRNVFEILGLLMDNISDLQQELPTNYLKHIFNCRLNEKQLTLFENINTTFYIDYLNRRTMYISRIKSLLQCMKHTPRNKIAANEAISKIEEYLNLVSQQQRYTIYDVIAETDSAINLVSERVYGKPSQAKQLVLDVIMENKGGSGTTVVRKRRQKNSGKGGTKKWLTLDTTSLPQKSDLNEGEIEEDDEGDDDGGEERPIKIKDKSREKELDSLQLSKREKQRLKGEAKKKKLESKRKNQKDHNRQGLEIEHTGGSEEDVDDIDDEELIELENKLEEIVLHHPVEEIPLTEKVHNEDAVANVKPEAIQDNISTGFKYKSINSKQKWK